MDVEWLDPWGPIESAEVGLRLVAGLQRELPDGHVLRGARVKPVARRGDCDDGLFSFDDGRVAIVHLMFSRSAGLSADLPTTRLFDSLDRFVEDAMKPEHEEHA
jgi:hypothetical protein